MVQVIPYLCASLKEMRLQALILSYKLEVPQVIASNLSSHNKKGAKYKIISPLDVIVVHCIYTQQNGTKH